MEIKLECGNIAQIDAEDFQKIQGYTWRTNNQGYVVSWLRNKGEKRVILMHRVILGVIEKTTIVDHIDHDPLNNKKENLRTCTHAENMRNRLHSKNNKLGAKGIYKNRDKFRVRIVANKVNYNLGTFENLETAKQVYWEAAKRLHGNFANAGAK